MHLHKVIIVLLLLFKISEAISQPSFSEVWVPDNGDGTYKNPVINADYSDPDVIRTGDDYYLVASSFTCQPGIPVLHSRDLVNWTIINYVYTSLPLERYKKPQHGNGSWAPSIRYHNGIYYVYFCTPEDGLFVATTTNPAKKWTLRLVQSVGLWEDPCPFWDEDGKAYLLHGVLGAGPAILHRMSADGMRLLDNGRLIYLDLKKQPVLEGFKFMEKRDGYYYFAAPAGGVSTGWQSVFRSRNIYGPYEDKIVLHQGKTNINGPHQGGLVQTPKGEWWFMHFQDRKVYGRVVHLQPAFWKNGWPVIGIDSNGDGIGEPVLTYRKPATDKQSSIFTPQESDEFSSANLGLQWQWQASPDNSWYKLQPEAGKIKLIAVPVPTEGGGLLHAGNLLLQKLPAQLLMVESKQEFRPSAIGQRAGIVVMGSSQTYLCQEKTENGIMIYLYEGRKLIRSLQTARADSTVCNSSTVWFRAYLHNDTTCSYKYSLNGEKFTSIGTRYKIAAGTWIGAKMGIFCLDPNIPATPSGYAEFDYFSVKKSDGD